MAREEKPVRLRMVDDETSEAAPVIRLKNREIESRDKEPKPVRLGPQPAADSSSQRLDLPDKEEFELRTHQPGIDVLIEPEISHPDQLEQSWGEETVRRNPIPWGWFALIGLAIAGAVLWSLSRVETADTQADQIRTTTESALVDEAKEEQEATQLIDRLDATIRKFFSATSVESLARIVRQPNRVAPLMRRYYGDKPLLLGPLKSVKSLQPLTLGDRGNFWVATVQPTNGSARNVVLEITDSGEPRIDWETFVCYQPMKWDDFARQRPTGTSLDFRVYVEKDDFYSHEFADSNQWTCFRLTALDSEETLFGYAHAGSPEARDLGTLVEQNEGRRTSLILRLSIPEGLKSHNGVVIEKLLSTRWLYLDPPDTGS